MVGGPTGLLGASEFFGLGDGGRIDLAESTVSLGHRVFELLDDAAMGSFPVAQLDLQLMDAGLCRPQLLNLGPEAVPVGKTFVELSDVLPQHSDFLLHDLAGLVGGPTGLLGASEFFGLGDGGRIDLAESTVSLGHRVFELLDDAAMGSFPVAQLDLQLMDAGLR